MVRDPGRREVPGGYESYEVCNAVKRHQHSEGDAHWISSFRLLRRPDDVVRCHAMPFARTMQQRNHDADVVESLMSGCSTTHNVSAVGGRMKSLDPSYSGREFVSAHEQEDGAR
jgi:hypothetical protein